MTQVNSEETLFGMKCIALENKITTDDADQRGSKTEQEEH